MRSNSSLKSESSSSSLFLIDAVQYTPKGRHLKSSFGGPSFRPANACLDLGLESSRTNTPASLSSLSSLDPLARTRLSGFLTTPEFSRTNSGRNSRASGRSSALSETLSRRISGSSNVASEADAELFRIDSAGSIISRSFSAEATPRRTLSGDSVVGRTRSADSILSIDDAVCSRTRSADSVVSEGRAELSSILSGD